MCATHLCTNGHRCHDIICNYTISVQHCQMISECSVRKRPQNLTP
uniref:Uncharacterized protein n=1 Tax=Arundo donax TaxID=35708 RepID=A0A0A9A792_ARUDO